MLVACGGRAADESPSTHVAAPADPDQQARDNEGRCKRGQQEHRSTLGFDPSFITCMIKAQQPLLKRCYEDSLAVDGNLAGRVVLEFEVTPDGKTASRTIEDDTSNEGFTRCLNNVISDIVFDPAPEQAVVYEYPFVFAPQR